MARRPSSVRLSVCMSVNFCANRFFSQTIDRIATKLAHDGLHPGCAQVRVSILIRALFWILGKSYYVTDDLVFIYDPYFPQLGLLQAMLVSKSKTKRIDTTVRKNHVKFGHFAQLVFPTHPCLTPPLPTRVTR